MKKLIFLLLLMFAWSLYAEKVTLKSKNKTETIDVEDSLYLGYGNKVSEVEFESENPEITMLTLEGAAFIHDYSFIAKCKNLEILVINDVKPENLDFLENCKKLKIIAFDSVPLAKVPDLRKLPELEYFAMTNCILADSTELLNHGEKLKFVNVCYNKISKLSKPRADDRTVYFISGNPIKKSKYKNYNFNADISEILPKKYSKYIR